MKNIDELKYDLEIMKIELEMRKVQGELNQHSPLNYITIRSKCPRCDANFNHQVEGSYFARK